MELQCSLSIIALYTHGGCTSRHKGPSGPMVQTDPCGGEEGDQGKEQFCNDLEDVNCPVFVNASCSLGGWSWSMPFLPSGDDTVCTSPGTLKFFH